MRTQPNGLAACIWRAMIALLTHFTTRVGPIIRELHEAREQAGASLSEVARLREIEANLALRFAGLETELEQIVGERRARGLLGPTALAALTPRLDATPAYALAGAAGAAGSAGSARGPPPKLAKHTSFAPALDARPHTSHGAEHLERRAEHLERRAEHLAERPAAPREKPGCRSVTTY